MIDNRRFIKNIPQFYNSKGSEKSIELFFRLLYNTKATIAYPSTDILRASAGRWNRDAILKLDTTGYSGDVTYVYFGESYSVDQDDENNAYVIQIGNNSDPFNLIGKKVTIRFSETIPGTGVVQTHFITDIFDVKDTTNGVIFELTSDINQNTRILDGATVEFDGLVYGTLTRQMISFSIVDSGAGFTRGDILSINEEGPSGLYFSSTYVDSLGSFSAYVANNSINGGIIRVSVIGPEGNILDGSIIHTGYQYQSTTFETEVTTLGIDDVGLFNITTGFIYRPPGVFLDSSGLLSDVCRLQDNFYYQPFSYVVRTKQEPSTWFQSFKKVVHPAGLQLFSEYILAETLSLRNSINIEYGELDTPHTTETPGTPLVLREVSPGVYNFFSSGLADIEMIFDSGIITLVPVGTQPEKRRLIGYLQANGSVTIY